MSGDAHDIVSMFENPGNYKTSLSLITQYASTDSYTKISKIIKGEVNGLARDVDWVKKVSLILSDRFTKSSPLFNKRDYEGLVDIMEFLIEALNMTSNKYSSTNVFLCLFHLNKHILKMEALWDYRLQSKVFDAVSRAKFPLERESTKPKVTTFRESMYSITWNEMRDAVRTSETDKNMEMIIMAVRWLASYSVQDLSKVASKLQKGISCALFAPYDVDRLQYLLSDLCEDYSKLVKQGVADGLLNPYEVPTYPSFYCSVMTEAYSKLKEHRKGLNWLAQWLLKEPSVLGERSGPFDLFGPPCIDEWSTQWVRLKQEARSSEIEQVTVQDLLQDDPKGEEIVAEALLLELNSYFTCKYVLSDAISTVGERLEDIGRNVCEKALGLLAQAIGFWWNEEDTNEKFCVSCCEKALDLLSDSANKEEGNALLLIVSAIARAWLALTHSKCLSTAAKKDLDFIQDEEKPKTSSGSGKVSPDILPKDDRVVPSITSNNLNDEHEIASLLICCIDSLYTIVHFDEVVIKKLFDISPALILLTARLCAYHLSTLGDTYSSIRAWYVCFVVAKIYDAKYIQLTAGLEVYKQTPQSIRSTVTTLEELTEAGIQNTSQYMSIAFFSRIDLVKSIVAFKEKQYADGILDLSKVLKYREDKSNIDATHLLMAEAHHLLAQYRLSQESNNFGMDSIDSNLALLTPSALVIQAYKICCGLIRNPNPHVSGWTDLCFNKHLMQVIFEQMPMTLKILKDSGNVKEMLSYGSDLIYLSQSHGFVSRTIELLNPIIEVEILGRHFGQCIEKIDSIHRMLTASDIVMCAHRGEMREDAVLELLKKLELDLENPLPFPMPNVKVVLNSVTSPESERSQFVRKEFPDPSSPTLSLRKLYPPRFLFHSLSCSCYVCLHPTIIPTIMKYLHILVRYAVCSNDNKTALIIVSLAKLHHLKACLRVMFHFERMTVRLSQAFHAKKVGRDALERAYLPFIFHPEFNLSSTLAESTPVSNMNLIIKLYKHIQEGHEVSGETDKAELLAPIELLSAAIYERYFGTDENRVHNSGVRQLIQNAE